MKNEDIGTALTLFDKGKYEECVELLITIYNSNIEKEWIESFFYQNFITPNEQEFQQNYADNAHDLTKIGYDECLIDFIPVSDNKYYLFLKNERAFLGSFCLDDLDESGKAVFHNLLIADTWDLRKMIPFIRQKTYQTVYIILGDYAKAFVSFLKVKDITSMFLDNAILFSDIEEMKSFFLEYPSYYLPHEVCAVQSELYIGIIDKLREQRIRDTKSPRDRVFLSICIPSYNRGHRALENIKNMQALKYDAEIELLISDNNSEKNVEGYKEIEKIQATDSRVKYIRLPQNIMAFGNICNLLEHATGYFIMFASDEDMLKTENMGVCLDYLFNHLECGVGTFVHVGHNGGFDEEKYIDNPYLRVVQALNTNYLTGITLNRNVLQRRNALEILKSYESNTFAWSYPHSALSILAAEHNNMFVSDIVLWLEGEDENKYESIIDIFQAKSRIQQGIDTIDFIRKEMDLPQEYLAGIISERNWKIYFLIGLAFDIYGDNETQYTWIDSCLVIYNGWRKYYESLPLPAESSIHFNKTNKKLFWEKLFENPMQKRMNEKELRDFQITTTIAKYLDDNGQDVGSIDFVKLEQAWKDFVENYQEIQGE